MSSNKTVVVAYKKHYTSIDKLIKNIQKKLNLNKELEANWGTVGSLAHIEELLREIDQFLTK